MKKFLLGLLGCLVLAIAILQAIPVDRSNPPVEEVVDAPPGVRAILRRSCWDCHSNETVWPWYAWVAPVSWTVTHDVAEGRAKVNFTTWNRYDADERAHLAREIRKEVGEGEMPLAIYLPMHPEARLSDADKATLLAWASAGGSAESARGD